MKNQKKFLKLKKKINFKNNFNYFFLSLNVLFYYYLFLSYIFFKLKSEQLHKTILFQFYGKILANSRKKVCCFLKESENNAFITITDGLGRVIFSLSGGKVGLKTKKRKNSPIIIHLLIQECVRRLKLKRISVIHSLFLTSPNRRWLTDFLFKLKRSHIQIVSLRYTAPRIHNSGLSRKKKIRRI